MASFNFTDIEGRTFEIEAPEGLNRDAVIQQLGEAGINIPGQPQGIASAALEAAREPAQQARRGFQELGALLPETGQTTSTLANVAIGAPRAALESVGEVAASFIEPEALAAGGLGAIGKAVARPAAQAVGQAVKQGATGPFTTALKTPSVISGQANKRAFRSLEKIKQRIFKQSAPEQLDRARRIVQAGPQVKQKFLTSIEQLAKDPSALAQTDSSLLLAAKDVAGQLQARGGAFAGLNKSSARKIARILNKRFPGLTKALDRVTDAFKAAGQPGTPVSLLQALTPGGRATQAATLPGVRRVAGAAVGAAGRAAGNILEQLPQVGALAGQQIRRQ